jgi:hypothetical protein
VTQTFIEKGECPIPFFHLFDSQLPTAGALAGNVGLYDTGQNQFRNQLSANADYRAQQAQDFSQSHANDQLQLQRDALDATNQRFDAGLQQRYDLTPTPEDRVELEQLKQAASDQRLTTRGQQRLDELGQRFQNAQALQQPKLDLGYYKTDQGNQTRTDINHNNWNNRDAQNAERLQAQKDMFEKKLALQQAKLRAAQDNNPNNYRVAAARAADLLRAAAMHRSSISRQYSSIASQLQSLPMLNREPFISQRANLTRTLDAIRAAMAEAEKEYQNAMGEANALRAGAIGGGGPSDQNNIGAPGAVGQPGSGSYQPATGGPQGADNPIQVLNQVTQQVLSEMPTASNEAVRIEVKSRLVNLGINPRDLGVQ